MRFPFRLFAAGTAVAAALGLSACDSVSSSTLTGATQGWSASAYSTNLKGICPSKVAIQTNWWPEPDHALFYQLIGPHGTIDTSNNSYSGPLGDTGVQAEILAGGPAVGFQTVTSQLYTNDSILLGLVGTDEAIGSSASQPTTAVLAWYEKNPQIFFWGNSSWNFTDVAAIGKAGVKVLAFNGATYLNVFEGEGLLKKAQVDTSYSGNPAQFVAAGGDVVSQGFITSEPYVYAHDVKAWGKPVKYLLVNDEYPVYQNAVVIRSGALAANRACLAKLVPLLQRAAVDYLRDPAPINQAIYSFATKLKGGPQLSLAGSAAADHLLTSLGIAGNGPDGVFGSFDPARVQTLINQLKGVSAAQGKPVKAGLTPADLVTNQFLDQKVKL